MDTQTAVETVENEEKAPTTEEVVTAMMKQNTGRHFLDSGGAYGRNWERNQARDFAKEQRVALSFRWKEIGIDINLWHWLTSKLTYSHKIQKLWDEWHNMEENARTADLGLMDGFPDFLKSKGWKVESVWGWGDKNIPLVENSYNSDCSLSQTIQWGAFRAETPEGEEDWFDDVIIMMSVHGGCDVRGGYSDVKCFVTSDSEWSTVCCYNDATIYCDNDECRASWYTDSGHHWYASNSEKDMKAYKLVASDDDDAPDGPKAGILFIDTDTDTGYCPECGRGKLDADFN